MRVYTIRNGLDGQYVDARAGKRKRVEPLHLVGAHLPASDPFGFRGRRCELLALSILADHFKELDGAVLRGRARSWKLHRRFLDELLGPHDDVIADGTKLDSLDIRAWVKKATARARQLTLKVTEE